MAGNTYPTAQSGYREGTNIFLDKSDTPESEGDIPFSKKDKGNAEPEEEDDEEEEYAVEKIMTHRWHPKKNPKLQYQVKWIGWEETTWEPEEHLDNCPEELAEYFAINGGKPTNTPASASAQKRPAPESSSSQVRGRPSANKKTKTEDELGVIRSASGENTWRAPSGSWEDHVLAVDSMTRDENGDNIAFLVWNNKHKSRHSTKLLNHKCPQKLLAFYEAHLFFNSFKPEDEEETPMKQIAAEPKATPSADNNGAAHNDEDEETEGVKGVASTV